MQRHGTRARYVHGCRCGRCTKANTDYHYDYRNFPPPRRRYARHGEVAKYDSGCRCRQCRAAKAAAIREYYYSHLKTERARKRKKKGKVRR